ncbi:helix-turn-helix domain-containing protein [Streptomyces sp. WM6378]|uniref:helix-turn-helix domain-containing protein n=1 Tax=Streptomyces sp. WM6378 TaxID=1415557 RepID=UPI002D219215|nr:helix-turn-helix domain-containing protein [Streptomyces sp. WM6378]
MLSVVVVSVAVVQLRYQYRAYPTPGQCISAARVFGCRRVVWNDALARIRPVKASNKLLGNPKARTAQGPYLQVPKNADRACRARIEKPPGSGPACE